MNYISHLLDDKEMKLLAAETGLGIESIEFSVAENLDCLDRTLISYEKRRREIGASALTLHGPFLDLNPMAYDSLVAQATMIRYNQAYEAAQKLGAKKIIYHSCFLPQVYFLEGWAERMIAFQERFLADKTDEIQILMENVLDPDPYPLLEVAERITHPAFGLCLDVGHANCYSEVSVDQWVKVLGTKIRHLHLHDNNGDRDAHLALGQGTVPTQEVGELLKKGIEVTVECRSAADVRTTQDTIMQQKFMYIKRE